MANQEQDDASMRSEANNEREDFDLSGTLLGKPKGWSLKIELLFLHFCIYCLCG
jgi:hypothetical protein